jgi:hypothetical protein
VTCTRINQWSFETNEQDWIIYPGGLSFSYTLTGSAAYTGSYGIRYGYLAYAWGLSQQGSACRWGAWTRRDGFSPIFPDFLLFSVHGGGEYIQVRIYLEANQIGIRDSNRGTLALVALPDRISEHGIWQHWGVAYKSHASTGFMTFYLDGNPIVSYTGDTRMGGTVAEFTAAYWIGKSSILGQGGINNDVDDVYFDLCTADEPDTFVTPNRFLISVPENVGTYDQWVPNVALADNYTMVDEIPPDGDTTYVEAITDGAIDSYVMSDIAVPDGYEIAAVVPSAYAKQIFTTEVPQLKLLAFDGVNFRRSDALSLTSDYGFVSARFTLQPDGNPWNETDFNNMEMGFESVIG